MAKYGNINSKLKYWRMKQLKEIKRVWVMKNPLNYGKKD
jgi:hypothetical protein